MGNIVLMFICKGGSVSVECDNLESMDWVINEMEKRGFKMWPGIISNYEPTQKEIDNSHDDERYDFEPSVKFCPIHGEKKKWQDTKDGGHYCGEKVDGKWCGYKEDEKGKMVKPPKSKPDYIQF